MSDELPTDDALIKKFGAMAFFQYKHLPEVLQKFSKPFGGLAYDMILALKDSPHQAEVSAGLRKLLEAKDCFVRARLPADGKPIPK